MTPDSRQVRIDAHALRKFVRESNRIEGILSVSLGSIVAHRRLLALDYVRVPDLEAFVEVVAARPLRRAVGQDVIVGSHRPPPGGPGIEHDLDFLLRDINSGDLTPYKAHVEYETLHPFLDGNGRSGRALWAWQMLRDGRDPFAIPFLHRFYYQSLDGARS